MDMMIFFPKNENNKIEFTSEELKKVLDDIYDIGYKDGKNSCNWIYTYPKTDTSPYYISSSSSDDTIDIKSSTVSNSNTITTHCGHSCDGNCEEKLDCCSC